MLQDATTQWDRFLVFLTEYNDWTDIFNLAVGAVLIMAVTLIFRRCFRKKPGEVMVVNRGEYVLSKREIRQKESNLIADEVENFLLKLYTNGKLTSERYQHWHLRFGTQLALKDLLPVKITPEQLKQAMKARRDCAKYRPVPFPKETPKPKLKKLNALETALLKHIS